MNTHFKRILRRVFTVLGFHDDMDPYLKEIMPLILLSSLFARGPFRINENGKFVVGFLSPHGLYFALSFGLVTYFMIDVLRRSDISNCFIRGDYASLHTAISNLLTVFLHFSILPAMLTKWEPTVRYIEEWGELNTKYEEAMGSKHEYKCARIVSKVAVMLLFVSVMLTVGTEVILEEEWYMTISTVVFCSVTSELMLVIFSYLELMLMASSINTKLKSLIRNNCLSAKELFALRRLWLKCSRVARLTGSSCTLQLLTDVTVSATAYSVAFFVIVACLTTGEYHKVPRYFLGITLPWIRLFCLFETGELTSHHIGSKIGLTISTARIDCVDIGTANEVELFIQCISSNYPNLNINGFLSVSRRSVAVLMSEAYLYVIVLMQIQISREHG